MPHPIPVMLMVLDGFGAADATDPGYNPNGDAIHLARIPTWDRLLQTYPHTLLCASGRAVGLPDGLMGNSEVGHQTMGAGRVIWQDITRIDNALTQGTFFQNPALQEALRHVQEQKTRLHLLGLVSNGGVHSMDRHYFALLEAAKKGGLKPNQVIFHAITDGRDTSPTSGVRHVHALLEKMNQIGIGVLATLSGRYYAMDRDQRWDRTQLYYDALTRGEGRSAEDPLTAIQRSYEEGITDEFILPVVFTDPGKTGVPRAVLESGDALLCFNFRPDRMRQLVRTLTEKDFREFERSVAPPPIQCTLMTLYDKTFSLPVLFPPQTTEQTFGEVVSQRGLRQLRIAETEKYAHVTYFFNCGVEKPYPGEDRILIPSAKVATYDLKPEMSAPEITRSALEKIRQGLYNVIILNFANPDMVGHTGNLGATIQALEVVDACLNDLATEILSQRGHLLITADHGNAEEMIDPQTGEKHTAHTTSLVPCVLVSETYRGRRFSDGLYPKALGFQGSPSPSWGEGRGEGLPRIENLFPLGIGEDPRLRPEGSQRRLQRRGIIPLRRTLTDIAPTLLQLLGLEAPPLMEGHSLIG